ncbi:hypothetical protein RN001_003544 [Aquatica leii]|uniref:Uncharacterized protein n=1 Tax=Aquatica leii TaxID=1421715 RepID=A0AAN7PIQ1_9COLE|nr:hypothetical protein RN001_003544 [Aquatica leii]
MKLLFLLIIPVSVLCKISTKELQADVVHLTSILFSNLEGDPYLKNATLKQSKVFIDKQVANYMALMKKTHGLNEHSLTRRSLPIDETTTLIKDNSEHEKIFMVVASFKENKNDSYEVEVPIYQWLGRHFDIVNHIKTYGAKKITPFIIGNSHFLVVANFQNNFDDNGVQNYETNSVVYKYVEGYFIPFQSFKLNGVSEWLPVMGHNGEFVLFAACKFDGIKIFQYNGWKFTESKVQYTDEAFSKGVLSMRTFEFNDKILIEQLQLALDSNEDNVINGDFSVDNLNLENTDTYIESISSNFINNENTSNFISSIINIDHDFIVENGFELENVIVSEISPQHVNNHPASSMVYTDNEKHLSEVIINGDVVFQKGLLLDGKLNGINFTKENVLLKQGNQSLSRLDLNLLATELLDADFINDIDMSQIDSINHPPIVLEKIDTLNVKTAQIKGFINHVDISSFMKYALKTSGTQTITGKYKFDSLYVESFDVNTLSGKNLTDELVLIDDGEYVLNQAAEFVSTLAADTVVVSDSFNHVFVIDDDLDILLANSSKIQHITGHKVFDEVELMNPIKLAGRINNPKIDRMNPVKITNEEIIVSGDYTIKGDFQVEQLLLVSEIKSANVSVTNLQSNGVKLSDNEIPCHLQFLQQVNVRTLRYCKLKTTCMHFQVEELSTDAVNDILVNSLVVMGTDEEQIITGTKTFLSDVFVTDNTKLDYVNGVHLPTLEHDVLRITGDQTITGNHQFENIIANRVFNVKTTFGGRPWENVVTTKPGQVIHDTVVLTDDLQLDQLETESLLLSPNSLINNYNFTFMIEDAVYRNDTIAINRQINLENIIIENLHADNIDVTVIPKTINESKVMFEFNGDINIPSKISIEEIYFTDSLNNMNSKDFEDHWLSNEDEQIFRGDQTFNKIVIFGNLFVESGFLNDVNITYVSDDSVKIDENHEFAIVEFKKGLASIYGITLDGGFESLDLNDIVLSHTEDVQVIVDEIAFKSDVKINGEVAFRGLISGFNITEFCEYSYERSRGTKNLRINGNAYFAKGPEINFINKISVKKMLETIWFTTQNCIVSEDMEFENILFQEDVVVHGFVDDTKIQSIAQTYFSKTKNQNVSAFYNFDDNVLFGNGIYAPRATIRGAISEINLGEFVSTALLNNYEQVFENTLNLIDCEIREFLGDYTVNDLNLQNDVMRYDQKNVVTGKKTVSDIKSYMLKIDKNVLVQNVSLVPWMYDSVMKSGTFQLQGKAYKNRDVEFQSSIYFNGSIVTPNIHVEKLYQGVNVSDLVHNVTQLSATHNYTENFEKLLTVSSTVKESLQRHAYFVNYYKIKQIYQNIDIVIPVSFPSDTNQYLACVTKENHKYTIKFDVWDTNLEVFHRATAMYDKYEGSIFEITRSGLQQIVPAILHNGTEYVSSMDLPLLNKCVFLLFNVNAFIYCQSLVASGSSGKYWNPFQEIETFNSVEGTVTSVNNITYIFILNAGTINDPSSVDVWKFDINTKLFQKEQSIYVPYPTSISTISYKSFNYFAVASGYMQNSKYEGMITIRKYDTTQQQYIQWQDIRLNVPTQVLFAELPTQELILYVTTNNPTQPLLMYQYEDKNIMLSTVNIAAILVTVLSRRILKTTASQNVLQKMNIGLNLSRATLTIGVLNIVHCFFQNRHQLRNSILCLKQQIFNSKEYDVSLSSHLSETLGVIPVRSLQDVEHLERSSTADNHRRNKNFNNENLPYEYRRPSCNITSHKQDDCKVDKSRLRKRSNGITKINKRVLRTRKHENLK